MRFKLNDSCNCGGDAILVTRTDYLNHVNIRTCFWIECNKCFKDTKPSVSLEAIYERWEKIKKGEQDESSM